MQLEQQLQILEEFGFTLEPGVTIDHILYSFNREDYEEEPFDLILFTLGIEIEKEPWGRRYSKRIWNFDTECIWQTGDYAKIAQNLSDVAGKPHALQGITDFVDLNGKTGWLSYKVGDVQRCWQVKIDDDWADPMVTNYVMSDLETSEGRFYGRDNGQASILCYLTKKDAERLNVLCNRAWLPMTPNDLDVALERTPEMVEAPFKPKGGLMASLRKWFG